MYAGVPNAATSSRRTRSERLAGSSARAARCAMPKSKIFTSPRSADEDVRRLDVAVDDAALVRVGEPARDGGADGRDSVRRRRSGRFSSDGREAEAVDELEHEVHLASRLRRTRRAARCSGGTASARTLRFALELRRERRRRRDRALQHLERDDAPERLLDRLVDRRERARARAPRGRGSPRWSEGPPRAVARRHAARPCATRSEWPVISAGCGEAEELEHRRRDVADAPARRERAPSGRRRSRRGAAPG